MRRRPAALKRVCVRSSIEAIGTSIASPMAAMSRAAHHCLAGALAFCLGLLRGVTRQRHCSRRKAGKI